VRDGGPSVVILCGGAGTRLREETEFRPKPLVQIGGRPILWHLMKHYAHHGFEEFVLCLGYKGHLIKDYFVHYDRFHADLEVEVGHDRPPEVIARRRADRFRVKLIETGADTMTGGRIRQAREHLARGTFMVTYGDAVADVNLERLLAFHRAHGLIGTVTAVHPVSPFGEIELGEGFVAEGWREKPLIPDMWVNGGYFVFEPAFFEYLESDDPDALVLEREPLERLVRDRQLAVFRHEGFWSCMDTFKDVERLNGLWASGESPWKVW
jgi:glucose-1-phosphate cytidylyltransferase